MALSPFFSELYQVVDRKSMTVRMFPDSFRKGYKKTRRWPQATGGTSQVFGSVLSIGHLHNLLVAIPQNHQGMPNQLVQLTHDLTSHSSGGLAASSFPHSSTPIRKMQALRRFFLHKIHKNNLCFLCNSRRAFLKCSEIPVILRFFKQLLAITVAKMYNISIEK